MLKNLALFFLVIVCFGCKPKNWWQDYVILDESKVPAYTLPDPLICSDGTAVTTDSLWWNKRRPELLKLFSKYEYGEIPADKHDSLTFVLHKSRNNALGGKAIMKEIDIYFTPAKDSNCMRLLVYIPKNATRPVPCFLGLNFNGNQSISADTGISITNRWVSDFEGSENHHANNKSRGIDSSRWPLELIVSRGYAVATAYYGDLDPDFDDGFKNGIQPLFYRNGQQKPDSNQWGSIGAWAWGLSRAMDYLETEKSIDAGKVAVLGHSRLGKTALWAAALDQRFALVISNNSGCGGAALSKRNFGENVFVINTYFPHWFCGNFKKFNNNEAALPFDQHELLALIAPRPLYVASASDDAWADPKGEFLSLLNADKVYKLLNTSGLPGNTMPSPGNAISGTLAYHIRKGKHDITVFDWKHYLDFADSKF